MATPPEDHVSIIKVTAARSERVDDVLAEEEPLEIRLRYKHSGKEITKSISVTMRTPGHDEELALGFLYTEGIISAMADVLSVHHASMDNGNVVIVSLNDHIRPDISRLERNFYTTSSCGVCGKASIEAVFAACKILDTKDDLRVPASLLYTLPAILRRHQSVFEHTGGIHACAIFDINGAMILAREDVGRHNALDKLIGASLRENTIPLSGPILLLSGRASFELMQKAAMAGIKIVAAIGAPSTLAARMATEWGMTLTGFLRDERFNIYSAPERIIV